MGEKGYHLANQVPAAKEACGRVREEYTLTLLKGDRQIPAQHGRIGTLDRDLLLGQMTPGERTQQLFGYQGIVKSQSLGPEAGIWQSLASVS